MRKNKIKLIGSLITLGLFVFLSTGTAYAGQYGEEEEYNLRFKITKEVRIQGDSEWKDKVTDVKEGEVVEFRIKIRNKSDDPADATDDMKMEDFLPEEMTKVGGNGPDLHSPYNLFFSFSLCKKMRALRFWFTKGKRE